MGIGSLTKLGISKGMSLGRELFGFLLRSDLNVAKIAEWAGITMDTLKDAPPEALSAILERAARSGAIDPREANNINIQLAKDAQEVAPDPITVYHASPNKIEGAFRPSNRDVGIHFAGNPDLATNAAVKSFVDNFDSAENVKPYKFSINASPDQIADIPSVGGRFDFYDILEGLVSSKKITDETFKEIYDGLESIEQSGDYYDEIMEAQNNYFTEKLSGENNIKVLKYFNDFDAGPTWKDMEAGIFESGVKPDYSYMVLDPDIIGEAGVAPDNVVSFSDAKNDQMVSKIKGAIQNMPYTMNLPYEIGQKLNSEGKLPLPIGTNLLPLGGKGYPDEVHKIIGYKGDIYNPALYGYEVQAPNGDIFFQAISDPASGLRQQRADKVGSFTAALGPEGLTGMRFVPPSRPVRQAVEGPQISEAEQKVIDQEYNDLFGDFE
jgi:hypothetical protein